jgi:hypothetical protein
MPSAAWQREAAKTRQPRLAKLVIPVETPCHICTHVRSSHSALVLTAPCRVTGCDCTAFEPICGCGHLLCSHTWGTPPNVWACAQCRCLQFGAGAETPLRLFA